MGLLTRLRGAATQTTTVETVLLQGDESVAVVGESHYVEALRAISGRTAQEHVRHPVTALLVPEPSNPHDKQAIAVWIDGLLVGYLSREDARAYARLVHQRSDRGQTAACRGRICAHEGTPNLGVWLDLPGPDEAVL